MRRAVLLLFLLALGVRVAAAVAFGIGGPPVEDERGYAMLAESLVEDGALELHVPQTVGADADTVPPRSSFRPPGLPLLLAPAAALGAGPVGMRLVVLVLAALGAPLLFVAARGVLADRGAFWCAAAYAVWPPAVYLSLRILSEGPSQALLLGATAVLVTHGGVRRAGAAGALAAASVLVRPAALLAAAALALAAGDRRRKAAFAAAALLVLAPWVARNVVLHGRPLITTNTGVTLVGGNSEPAYAAANSGKWLSPHAAYAGRADAPDLGMWGWAALGEERSDRQFTSDAWEWVSANPARAVRLAGRKLLRLFDPDPRSGKGDAQLKRVLGLVTLLPVLLLAASGLLSARSRAWLPWYALLAGTVVTAIVFYGDTRMRTAADPALLVLATAGLARLLPRLGLARTRVACEPERRDSE